MTLSMVPSSEGSLCHQGKVGQFPLANSLLPFLYAKASVQFSTKINDAAGKGSSLETSRIPAYIYR